MTKEQEILKAKHGTPKEFAAACERAVDDLMITPAESRAGIAKYQDEWNAAGVKNELQPAARGLRK